MWTCNLGIHNCSTGRGYMYMWPEPLASQGSNEVISCLYIHLQRPTTATTLIAFSDACGGQNHNINIACFWMHVVCSSEFSYTTISHKVMVSGHSYLPNDRDFRSIEKANRKCQHVYVPEEWSKLVEMCRKKILSLSLEWRPKTSSVRVNLEHRSYIGRKIWTRRRWIGCLFVGCNSWRISHFKSFTIIATMTWKIIYVEEISWASTWYGSHCSSSALWWSPPNQWEEAEGHSGTIGICSSRLSWVL